MPSKVQSSKDELAKRRSIIELIGMAIEQFNRSLSDRHKVAMFAMPLKGLEELRSNLRNATSGLQVSWMIASAISPPSNDLPTVEPVEEKQLSVKPSKRPARNRQRFDVLDNDCFTGSVLSAETLKTGLTGKVVLTRREFDHQWSSILNGDDLMVGIAEKYPGRG